MPGLDGIAGTADTTGARTEAAQPSSAIRRVFGITELLEQILLHVDEHTLLLSAQLVCTRFLSVIEVSPSLQRKLFFLNGIRPSKSRRSTTSSIIYNPFLPQITVALFLKRTYRPPQPQQPLPPSRPGSPGSTSRHGRASFSDILFWNVIHRWRGSVVPSDEEDHVEDDGEWDDEWEEEEEENEEEEDDPKAKYRRKDASWRRMFLTNPASRELVVLTVLDGPQEPASRDTDLSREVTAGDLIVPPPVRRRRRGQSWSEWYYGLASSRTLTLVYIEFPAGPRAKRDEYDDLWRRQSVPNEQRFDLLVVEVEERVGPLVRLEKARYGKQIAMFSLVACFLMLTMYYVLTAARFKPSLRF